MRNQYVSPKELEELGEGLVKEYLRKTRKWNSLSFDIEGFITEYLGLEVHYENFAEADAGKIGFLSDGKSPLMVYRAGRAVPVIFPEGAVVVDKYLLRCEESGRRRFTLAHEAAHAILQKFYPGQGTGNFHNEFDSEQNYTVRELREMFSLGERNADRLAAALLMAPFRVEKALGKYHAGRKIVCYGMNVFPTEEKCCIQKMADAMGVSYSAMLIQIRDLNMVAYRPIEEYIEETFGVQGDYE